MLQPYEIKVEQEERKKQKKRTKSSLLLSECTCTSKTLSEEFNHLESSNKKHRQVLVNFGLKRKKIFTLKSKKDNLHQMFLSYVAADPAFSKLLVNAYVVLQEYNLKFGTYVDVDNSKNLRDGSIVKAVFFPTRLERNDENPGSIKTQEPNHVWKSSTDLIQIDTSDDDEVDMTDISRNCEITNITVDVACDQSPAKKKKKKKKEKKRHSQDPQNSLEFPVESEQKVSDDNDIEIKLEAISANQLSVTKSSTSSSEEQNDVSTNTVDVACEQSTAKKKKKKKRHSQDSQNSLETPVESEQEVSNDTEIKLELSVNELSVSKSSAVSSEGHSEQDKCPILRPIRGSERSLPHPAITTGNIQHLNGTNIRPLLDNAVSQIEKQKESDHVRHTPGERDTQKVKEVSWDAVTRLQRACLEEVLKEPFYSVYSVGQIFRCKVFVNGNYFYGEGNLVTSAKQNAASAALAGMINNTIEYGAEERFGKRRRSGQNERRYNITHREKEETRRNTYGGEGNRREDNGRREGKGDECRQEKNRVRETEENSTRKGTERGVQEEREGERGGRERDESYRARRGRGSYSGRGGKGRLNSWGSRREIHGRVQRPFKRERMSQRGRGGKGRLNSWGSRREIHGRAQSL